MSLIACVDKGYREKLRPQDILFYRLRLSNQQYSQMTEVVVMNLWLYKITNLLTGKVLGTRFTIRPPSCIIPSTHSE